MKRPLLLTVLMGLLFALAGILMLATGYALVSSGPFRFDGRVVNKGTYFLYTVPILLVIGGAALVPAFALLRNRWWAQHVVATLCLLVVISAAVFGRAWRYAPWDFGELVFGYALILAPCFWYLYVKKRVKTYFAGLRQSKEGDGALNASAHNA